RRKKTRRTASAGSVNGNTAASASASAASWLARTVIRAGSREPSLLRDGFVNPDAIEQRFAGNAAIGQSCLDRYVMQGRCKPNLHVDTALSAIAAPQLCFDITHGQLDELGACQAKAIVI